MKRKIPSIVGSLVAVTAIVVSYNACSPGFQVENAASVGDFAAPSVDAVLAANGKVLYANNCASCHGDVDNSAKKDRNAPAIIAAIQNIPQMASLKGLISDTDADAIAAALTTTTCSPATLGKTIIRRMNYREYVNSTKDLLGTHTLAIADYPLDTRGDTWFDNDGSSIRTLGPDAAKLVTAAEKVADQILANTSSKFHSCNTAANKATCFQNLLTPVVRKAFRVPVTAAEVQPIVNFATAAPTPQEGVRDALVAILASPRFVFHVVNYTANRSGAIHALSAHELASRLALFLWSSIPDDTLMGLANSGDLMKPEVQKAQVDRMLKDPKAQTFIRSFPSQWLGYHDVMKAERSATVHPEFTPALKTSMLTEADMLVADIINRNLAADAFVTANYAFVDRTLASFYGLPFPSTSNAFASVMLDGVNRRGILTQAAVMTGTSNNDATHPIHRGVVLLARVICDPVGTPPQGVPTLASIDPSLPMKERLAVHSKDATCKSCHKSIDPVGLAYENFASTGKWRDRDGMHPVDSSGTMPDGFSFNKPGELAGWIATGDRFEKCVNRYLSIYATGRAPLAGETCYSNKIVKERVSATGATFNDLIKGIVSSDLFQRSVVKE